MRVDVASQVMAIVTAIWARDPEAMVRLGYDEPDDLVGDVVRRMLAAAPHDRARSTLGNWVHVVTRSAVCDAADRAKARAHACVSLGRDADASETAAQDAAPECGASELACAVAARIRASGAAYDVRCAALALLVLASEDACGIAEIPSARALGLSRPLVRDGLRLLRACTQEVVSGYL